MPSHSPPLSLPFSFLPLSEELPIRPVSPIDDFSDKQAFSKNFFGTHPVSSLKRILIDMISILLHLCSDLVNPWWDIWDTEDPVAKNFWTEAISLNCLIFQAGNGLAPRKDEYSHSTSDLEASHEHCSAWISLLTVFLSVGCRLWGRGNADMSKTAVWKGLGICSTFQGEGDEESYRPKFPAEFKYSTFTGELAWV